MKKTFSTVCPWPISIQSCYCSLHYWLGIFDSSTLCGDHHLNKQIKLAIIAHFFDCPVANIVDNVPSTIHVFCSNDHTTSWGFAYIRLIPKSLFCIQKQEVKLHHDAKMYHSNATHNAICIINLQSFLKVVGDYRVCILKYQSFLLHRQNSWELL